MSKIIIKQDEKDAVPTEVLATNIRTIAAAVKALRKGSLGDKALLLLISENCRTKNKRGYYIKNTVSVSTVKTVLDSIENLSSAYLK
jgi:hypothetical protein